MRRLLVVLGGLAVLGCGGVATAPAESRHAFGPAGDAPPAAAEAASGGVAAKLDAYVAECLNAFSPRTNDSYARYLQWVDAASGPTGREKNIYGLYTLNSEASECSEAVETAIATPPSLPELDAAARAYAEALAALQPRIDEAAEYYDDEMWRDDRFARGKVLHAPLMEAFERFRRADEALSARVALEETQIALQARASADPTRALVLDLYLAARTLARTAARAPVDDRGLLGLELEGFVAQVDAYGKALAALEAHAKRTDWDHSLLGEADELGDEATAVLRRVRDGRPFKSMERDWLGTSAGWMVKASPDALVRAYDGFVDEYNDVVESPKAQLSANRDSWRAR